MHHTHNLNSKLIAITGGIGAGKSIVSVILATMGYNVYDCDSRAKQLMNHSPIIKKELTSRFGEDVFNADGLLNKELLSSIIFNNADALASVNSIVHPVVREDISTWHKSRMCPVNFVETAILAEAGMQMMVDEVWNVTAPVETRIKRVVMRNNTTAEKVLERINSQSTSLEMVTTPIKTIVNDGINAVLPQVMSLLSGLQQ